MECQWARNRAIARPGYLQPEKGSGLRPGHPWSSARLARTICRPRPNGGISHVLAREAVVSRRTTIPLLTGRLRDAGFRFRYPSAAMARYPDGQAVAILALQQRRSTCYARLLGYAEGHSLRSCLRCVRCAVLVGLVLRTPYCSVRTRSAVESRTCRYTARRVRSGFPNLPGVS